MRVDVAGNVAIRGRRDAAGQRATAPDASARVGRLTAGHTRLTSKVAVVSRSDHPDVDVDYLFLQVAVDRSMVSAGQPCGKILAGVAPFALERGLVSAQGDTTDVARTLKATGIWPTASNRCG